MTCASAEPSGLIGAHAGAHGARQLRQRVHQQVVALRDRRTRLLHARLRMVRVGAQLRQVEVAAVAGQA